MKNLRVISILSILFVAFLTTNCNRSINSKLPCTGKNYFSDNQYFRASGSAEDYRHQNAKDKAMHSARTTLAQEISGKMEVVTEKYFGSDEVGFDTESRARFEEMSKGVVKEQLKSVRLICEEHQTVRKTNMKECFVAIEMSRESILEDINNKISKDEQLRLLYDKKKFEEVFNKEMEDYENERGY